MSKRQTKEAALFALLKKQYVGPIDALEQCGILSLAQRVSNWRREGIVINDRWQTSPTGSRYKQYRVARGTQS